ncbi:MAG: carboxymuconolactone decarboxylase family protein [Candidatus Bathyarchaeia archaeon]
MSDCQKRDKTTRLLEKLLKDRGYVQESRRILAKEDPEYLELYHNLWVHVMRHRCTLPLKFKELIIVAVDAATAYIEGLKLHIRDALKAGATKDEILEALETASLPGGIHVLSVSLPILEDILRDFNEGKAYDC